MCAPCIDIFHIIVNTKELSVLRKITLPRVMNRDDLDIFSCDFIRLSNQILKIPVTCDDESVIKLLRSENGRRKKRLS